MVGVAGMLVVKVLDVGQVVAEVVELAAFEVVGQ